MNKLPLMHDIVVMSFGDVNVAVGESVQNYNEMPGWLGLTPAETLSLCFQAQSRRSFELPAHKPIPQDMLLAIAQVKKVFPECEIENPRGSEPAWMVDAPRVGYTDEEKESHAAEDELRRRGESAAATGGPHASPAEQSAVASGLEVDTADQGDAQRSFQNTSSPDSRGRNRR